ncbi:hypothetical protein [Deinococcus aluminii]|uniref:Uncharacterized protein n=1 Tax=Deinococcus aluminii TaxID=1656885 RepID=A0ABP9XEU4_9DEIO
MTLALTGSAGSMEELIGQINRDIIQHREVLLLAVTALGALSIPPLRALRRWVYR